MKKIWVTVYSLIVSRELKDHGPIKGRGSYKYINRYIDVQA